MLGGEGNECSGRVGEVLVRGKRKEELSMGGKGWEISTHIVRCFLRNVDN